MIKFMSTNSEDFYMVTKDFR